MTLIFYFSYVPFCVLRSKWGLFGAAACEILVVIMILSTQLNTKDTTSSGITVKGLSWVDARFWT